MENNAELAARLLRAHFADFYPGQGPFRVQALEGNPPCVHIEAIPARLDDRGGKIFDDFQEYACDPYGIPVQQCDQPGLLTRQAIRIPIPDRETVLKIARAFGEQFASRLCSELRELPHDPEIIAAITAEARRVIKDTAGELGADNILKSLEESQKDPRAARDR